jgi:hypothetical protein
VGGIIWPVIKEPTDLTHHLAVEHQLELIGFDRGALGPHPQVDPEGNQHRGKFLELGFADAVEPAPAMHQGQQALAVEPIGGGNNPPPAKPNVKQGGELARLRTGLRTGDRTGTLTGRDRDRQPATFFALFQELK